MYMPMTFVKRSSIPIPVKGKVATDPQVTVNENGQMVFSTKAMQIIGGKACMRVAIAYDKEKRTVMMFPESHPKLPKNYPEKELWNLKHSSKGNSAGLSGSGSFLQSKDIFGSETYDYRESGGQTFPVTEREGCLLFSLPKGALQRKAKVTRTKRDKSDKKVASITGNGAPAEPELTLETA